MTETEYGRLADALFSELEQALEAAGLDYEMAPGGVLEVEFEDGGKLVVNRQAPMREIWVAGRSGGFHYRWLEGEWRDTRGGDRLFPALERMLSQQAGRTIRLG